LSTLASLPVRVVFAGISVVDPLTACGVATLLCGVAAITGWMPDRRAMQIDPITALGRD
jgi:hypothetical protein